MPDMGGQVTRTVISDGVATTYWPDGTVTTSSALGRTMEDECDTATGDHEDVVIIDHDNNLHTENGICATCGATVMRTWQPPLTDNPQWHWSVWRRPA